MSKLMSNQDNENSKIQKTQFDYSKLKGKIIEKYGSQGKFAKSIGISESVLSAFLNNKKANIRLETIRKMIELLEITDDKVGEYFFKP